MSLRPAAAVVGFVAVTLLNVVHGGFVSEPQQHSRIPFMASPYTKQGFKLEAIGGTSNELRQNNPPLADENRRKLFLTVPVLALLSTTATPNRANAIGPVKISLTPTSYTALPCPKDRPIPGQKAMAGMRGLCVTVEAKLDEVPPKNLNKVGVYGFVTDGVTGDSVLANNPDLSTDAGQFAMIEAITTDDRKIKFEFVAAVPAEKDLSGFDNGIGPLNFESLKVISFPGGEQYGAISPCEMNEFSDECEAWEQENGPYERGDFMMKSRSNRKS